MQTATAALPRSLAPAPEAELLRWTGAGGAVLLTGGAWAVTAGAGAAGLAAAIAGAGLVVLAWVLLGRTKRPVTWLRRTLVWWCAPLVPAPPLFSLDVYSYLAQGEVAARGFDPNVVSPAAGASAEAVARVSGHWRETPSPYGPLFGTVERGIAEITGGDPVAGIVLHRLAAVLGLLLVVWAVPRLAARAGASQRTALWLGVLNPLVLWHLIGGMHNDALMLGLMLAGTVVALDALDDARWWSVTAGIVLIALGAQVKLPALAALAIVGTALARRFGGGLLRFTLSGAAMVAAAVLVSVATSLAGRAGFGWVQALGTPSKVPSWMAPSNWPGFLAGAVSGAESGQAMISAGRVAGLVLVLCGVAVVLTRQLRGGISEVRALGLVMGVIVVLGPVVQPWYLLWAVVPLAAAGLWRTGLTAAVTMFALLVPPLAGDFTGRVGELVVGYGAGLVLVACAFLVLRRLVVSRVPGARG
ncbi:polyprenol phosphomannose-dependent alpha 1,6 mannosyltransferase MptB [Lentzea chajnantorensis]